LPISVLAARRASVVEPVAFPGVDVAAPDLLVVLAGVTDPRKSRGVRHRLVTVLAAAVCAVLAGARTYVAIAEWAHDLPITVRVRLGMGRRAPSESTIRRISRALDADELDRAVSAWLTARAADTRACSAGEPVRSIAVDGKTARGARQRDGQAVHLFAALDHTSGIVLGQTEVDAKTNEITAFAPLLDRIDITGAIVTADALHTQDRHARYLHEHGAHYVFIVKNNRPNLRAQLARLPWREVPVADHTRECGHGRAESRTLKLTAVAGAAGTGIAFPHARLAAQITRRRRRSATSRWATETVYAVTDLDFTDIRADHLAQIIRGHWTIENRLHWIRDVVFAEDHSQIRTGTGPATMAVLRNLALSRHRLAGATNIAAACRHTSRHPIRAAELLT
jgi:predicted transposase YbfD/YdcC